MQRAFFLFRPRGAGLLTVRRAAQSGPVAARARSSGSRAVRRRSAGRPAGTPGPVSRSTIRGSAIRYSPTREPQSAAVGRGQVLRPLGRVAEGERDHEPVRRPKRHDGCGVGRPGRPAGVSQDRVEREPAAAGDEPSDRGDGTGEAADRPAEPGLPGGERGWLGGHSMAPCSSSSPRTLAGSPMRSIAAMRPLADREPARR